MGPGAGVASERPLASTLWGLPSPWLGKKWTCFQSGEPAQVRVTTRYQVAEFCCGVGWAPPKSEASSKGQQASYGRRT